MSASWLSAENFERTQQIISAINTLSVYAKLNAAGIPDETSDAAEIADARELLRRFFEKFDQVLAKTKGGEKTFVKGIDPRLNSLAQKFEEAQNQYPRSELFEHPFGKIIELLYSEQTDDLIVLVDCLRGLRELLEQNCRTDVYNLLGEL